MLRRTLTVVLVAVALASWLQPATALPVAGTSIASYSVMTSRSVAPSGLIARAVLPSGVACPALMATVLGERRAVRSLPRRISTSTWPAFASIKVCEARIPVGATAAEFAGRGIPAAMPATVRNMALFGDTGCRIAKSQVQDCSDPATWPLATISAQIAQERPDVIIHTGDYFYREAPCPPTQLAACGSSPDPLAGYPFDDSAYGWIADVLLPMTPVLQSAPILFTRGNHEECSRGGNGYFLLLDPGWQNGSECAPRADGSVPLAAQEPFAIDLPLEGERSVRLVVVDSANGSDSPPLTPMPGKREFYEHAQRLAQGSGDAWLITHRPIFGLISATYAPTSAKKSETWTPWTSFDEQVASYGLLNRYDMILSSHVHLAQAVQVPGSPGQLTIGNGGTLLDAVEGYPMPSVGPLADATGQPQAPGLAPYPVPTSMWTAVRFGYAMAEPARAEGSWRVTMKDPVGGAFARCGISDRTIACR